MNQNTKTRSAIRRNAIVTATLLALAGARVASATPPTPAQLCQFKKMKAVGVVTKKVDVCLAKVLKNPSFDYPNCLSAPLAAFDNAIATIEAAGGCPIEKQHDVLLFDLNVAAGLPAAEVTSLQKHVFVTSTTYDGTFGGYSGYSGADYQCSQAAQAAGFGQLSQWKAWISDSSSAPADRFSRAATIPYVLMDGTTVVANNWADLTDGSLQHLIDQDEFGDPASAPFAVWTGTTASGTADSSNCQDWTSNSASDLGTQGVNALAVGADWTAQGTSGCDVPHRLYCIEQ